MKNRITVSFQELRTWQRNTQIVLNRAFPKYENSFLIEDAIAKALTELCDPNSKMSFSDNSLKHIAKCRMIDELRRRKKMDYLNDDILKTTPLSTETVFIDKDDCQWQIVVSTIPKIPNTRRRELLRTYFHADNGFVEPEKCSIKQLKTQFNMPSEQSVRTEIHRGLKDLRQLVFSPTNFI
jgi:hypothetical protein